jgi:YegS/Rv2252/BmrU family lipid kinase
MNQPEKPVAILNPRAAGGKTSRLWPAMREALERRLGMPVTLLTTERPGHAAVLARGALDAGSTLVIAIGGDGTVNEVANGFMHNDEAVNPEARLGFIPIGTGGDLQRTLGTPSDIEQAAGIVAAGEPFIIDVGKARLTGHDGAPVERYFVNLLSFGMGGDVSVRAKNFLSPLGGKAAFLYATLAVFLTYHGKRVRLTLDGVPQPQEFLITNIAIGNGRFHGGGMHPCPRAVMNDGLLEVTTIDRLTAYELVRDLPILYSDNIYQHAKVRHFRARHIRAESDEVTRIEVDGEALGRLPLEVSVLPRKLPILIAPDSVLLRV